MLCYIYIYIYAFSRRFYPKRLTLHSSYSFTFYQLFISVNLLSRVKMVKLLSTWQPFTGDTPDHRPSFRTVSVLFSLFLVHLPLLFLLILSFFIYRCRDRQRGRERKLSASYSGALRSRAAHQHSHNQRCGHGKVSDSMRVYSYTWFMSSCWSCDRDSASVGGASTECSRCIWRLWADFQTAAGNCSPQVKRIHCEDLWCL